jgi:hypothetical protein
MKQNCDSDHSVHENCQLTRVCATTRFNVMVCKDTVYMCMLFLTQISDTVFLARFEDK